MLNPTQILQQLKRPKLLVRAARLGLDDYQRAAHLKRILATDSLPRPAPAVARLIDIEADQNAARKEKRATYSVARHVDVLIALIAEAHALRATQSAT